MQPVIILHFTVVERISSGIKFQYWNKKCLITRLIRNCPAYKSCNTKWWYTIVCNENLKIFHAHFLVWYLSQQLIAMWFWWWIMELSTKNYAESLSLLWDAWFGALNHVAVTATATHFESLSPYFSPLVLLLFRYFTCSHLMVAIAEKWTGSS